MAKRRLKEIADDLGISFEKAQDVVMHELKEDMVTGKGKNTWINEEGQDILESNSPMPIKYRGRVLSEAPNNKFVFVYVSEIPLKVPVRIPYTLRGRLVGKYIYLESYTEGARTSYHYVKPPSIYGDTKT